jgi:mRNA interferase MazF
VNSQKPRKGWIYFIDPHKLILECGSKHKYPYKLDVPGDVECKHPQCKNKVNSSRIFRGEHPYVIWSNDGFHDDSGYIKTFNAIPLTSQETFKGLPTSYPINPTSQNGLTKKGYLLIHQMCCIEANCFKKLGETIWMDRIGQLNQPDKNEIEKRIIYFLGLENSIEDWFINNADSSILEKIFDKQPQDKKEAIVNNLLNKI